MRLSASSKQVYNSSEGEDVILDKPTDKTGTDPTTTYQ